MKKFIAGILTAMLFTTSVFAAEPFIEVSGFEGDMEVMYPNGIIKKTAAPAVVLYINGDAAGDADGIIKNGTTLVPLRVISERFGANVAWDAETKTVVINDAKTSIKCTIGDSAVVVNGERRETTNPAEIIDGSTYVPLRAISTAFGAKVGYVGDLAEDTRFVWVEQDMRVKVSEEDAGKIAEMRYFEDFLPSMQDAIFQIQGFSGVTKENIAEKFPSVGAVSCKVKYDLGHYWYVSIFENDSVGALVDKETGSVYAAHSFSLVNFAVAAEGDYSGWGWTFQ